MPSHRDRCYGADLYSLCSGLKADRVQGFHHTSVPALHSICHCNCSRWVAQHLRYGSAHTSVEQVRGANEMIWAHTVTPSVIFRPPRSYRASCYDQRRHPHVDLGNKRACRTGVHSGSRICSDFGRRTCSRQYRDDALEKDSALSRQDLVHVPVILALRIITHPTISL